MNLLARLRATVMGPSAPMGDPAWQAASTFDEVSELTAQWLEGLIGGPSAYPSPCDVDDAPMLKEALIALNRCGGFVTTCSQEGHSGWGLGQVSHIWWNQHAAVDGWATEDSCAWMEAAIATTPYVMVHEPMRRMTERQIARTGRHMTFQDGHPYTRFGVIDPYSDLTWLWSPALVEVWLQSRMFLIYDPEIGSNTLWPALHEIASNR